MRRPQFNLRTIFWLTVCVGCFCAGIRYGGVVQLEYLTYRVATIHEQLQENQSTMEKFNALAWRQKVIGPEEYAAYRTAKQRRNMLQTRLGELETRLERARSAGSLP